ncbi:MAG: hypothetical protein JXX14_07030 [Deltaproteobacteria bacterium]|nr:hypothetical protein [Deltaproteobacteria bacterium]
MTIFLRYFPAVLIGLKQLRQPTARTDNHRALRPDRSTTMLERAIHRLMIRSCLTKASCIVWRRNDNGNSGGDFGHNAPLGWHWS